MNNIEKFLTITTSFLALVGVYFNFLETALGLFATAICIIILFYNFIKWEYFKWKCGDDEAVDFQNILKISHRVIHLVLAFSFCLMLFNSILVSQFPSYVSKKTCRILVSETEKTHPNLKEINIDPVQLKSFSSKIEKLKPYATVLNQNVLQMENMEVLFIELGEDYKEHYVTFGWIITLFLILSIFILLIGDKIGYKSYSFTK